MIKIEILVGMATAAALLDVCRREAVGCLAAHAPVVPVPTMTVKVGDAALRQKFAKLCVGMD